MPGMIEGRWLLNGLGDEQYQRVKQSFTETSLLGKICSSEEIANSLLWLLDPSCIMTGQVVTVDAGFSLGKPPTPSVSNRQ
jgi:3-oxoacyl-[acyl-carrier protein] reductase